MVIIHRTTKEKHRMSEMIERVARALCREKWPHCGSPDAQSFVPGKPNWTDLQREARAAIEPIIAEINRIAADSLMSHPVWNAGVEALRVKINAALNGAKAQLSDKISE
jgi:hypothetical protein